MAKERLPIAAGVLLTLLAAGSAAQRRDTWVSTKHYVHEALQIQEADFTSKQLQAYAQAFGKTNKDVTFAKLLVGTGEEVRDYVDKGATHQTVENYFYRLPIEAPQGLRTWPRLAMVVKVGPTVLLRVREGEKVTETVISGRRDLLPGWAKGYEILDVTQLYDPPETVSGASVFVRNRRAVTQGEVESIADQLCALLPEFSFHVIARKDSWFLEHISFPFLYAFDPGYELPDRKTYRPKPEIWASRDRCSAPVR